MKGKESSVLVYEVLDAEAQELFEKKHGTIKLFEEGFDFIRISDSRKRYPYFVGVLN